MAKKLVKKKVISKPGVGGKNPPPEETRWAKGQSGNPNGRPKDPPGLSKLKNLSRVELVEVGNLVIKNDIKKLKAIAHPDSGESVLKTMIAAVCVKVIQKGDMHALDILLNRLVGKVKDEIEHKGNALGGGKIIVHMPSNGREAPLTKRETREP